MLKKFTLLIIILLASFASAGEVEITNYGFYQYAEISDSLPVEVEITGAITADSWDVMLDCDEDFYFDVIYDEIKLDAGQTKKVSTTLDLIGFSPGACDLTVSVNAKGWDSEDAYSEDPTLVLYLPESENEGKVTVYRNLPDKFTPGNTMPVNLDVIINDPSVTGVIVKEKIPNVLLEDMEWVFMVPDSFPHAYTIETVESNSPFGFDYDVIKFVLLVDDDKKNYDIKYYYKAPANFPEGENQGFGGTWEVLGLEGDIEGDWNVDSIGYVLPICPITDQDLLGYIQKWSNNELSSDADENDQIMMGVVDIWKGCE